MSVRSAGSGSGKNWAWRRLTFPGKELIKSLGKGPGRDWSPGLGDCSGGTAGGSGRVKLAVLPPSDHLPQSLGLLSNLVDESMEVGSLGTVDSGVPLAMGRQQIIRALPSLEGQLIVGDSPGYL